MAVWGTAEVAPVAVQQGTVAAARAKAAKVVAPLAQVAPSEEPAAARPERTVAA